MRSKMQDYKRKEQGFTLVELITVVAIVSLLVVYITIKLGSSNENAKVALANTFFLGSVPSALASYKARHMASCDDMVGATAAELRTGFVNRGLVGTTPWGEDWSLVYDHPNRRFSVIFPTQGMENPVASVTDIVQSVWDAPQLDGLALNATAATGAAYATTTGLTAAPTVPTTFVRGGSIQVWYDCI